MIALAAGALRGSVRLGSGSQASSSPVGDERDRPGATRQPRGAAEVDRALRLAGLRDLRRPATRGACSSSSRAAASGSLARRQAGEPFLDIRSQVTSGGEQGLLSVAFAPDYARSGLFYVYFTDKSQDERVVEYQARERRPAPTRARRGSCCGWPTPRPTTTAACCCSGPTSYSTSAPATAAAAGDQHGAHGNAQNLGSLLGKILRIDPRAVGRHALHGPRRQPVRRPRRRARPRSTPTACATRGASRSTARPATSSIGDVGQDAVEEIDFVRRGKGKGANFGWRRVRGPLALHAGRDARRARSSR